MQARRRTVRRPLPHAHAVQAAFSGCLRACSPQALPPARMQAVEVLRLHARPCRNGSPRACRQPPTHRPCGNGPSLPHAAASWGQPVTGPRSRTPYEATARPPAEVPTVATAGDSALEAALRRHRRRQRRRQRSEASSRQETAHAQSGGSSPGDSPREPSSKTANEHPPADPAVPARAVQTLRQAPTVPVQALLRRCRFRCHLFRRCLFRHDPRAASDIPGPAVFPA